MACVLSLPSGLPLSSVRAECTAGEGCPFLPGVLLSPHSLLQAGTVVWIGILVYTDPAGLRTYLAAQVTEQSPLGEGALAPLPVPSGVLPASHPLDPTGAWLAQACGASQRLSAPWGLSSSP